jgi:hypothetical protein
MTTIAPTHIPASIQPLIDSRLDTIDRMLLGRLPRAERLEIVREVESQIFELLAERTGDEPSREDILAVLGRLDPPEAYLPDELQDHAAPRRDAAYPRPAAARNADTSSPPASASAVISLAVLLILLILFPLTIGLANFVPGNAPVILTFWYGLTLIAFSGSVTAIVLAAKARLRGSWAVAGLVLGIFALLGTLAFAILGMML